MRTNSELIEDLANLSSSEWNERLAEEYKLPLDKFSELTSTYNYRVTSEDNIHHKIKSVFDMASEVENSEDKIEVNSFMRDIGSVEFDAGDSFDSLIFCGFVFNDSYSMNSLIKSCNYYNCVSQGSNFSSSRYIQTVFIDCDFKESEFSETIFTKCSFYDCNFRKARFISTDFYDCVFYNCEFGEIDADASQFNSNFIHNCVFTNSSMKVVRFTSCSISFCDFSNSLMRDSSLYDCNLIEIDFRSTNMADVQVVGTQSNNVMIDVMYSELFGIGVNEEDDEDYYEEDGDDDD